LSLLRIGIETDGTVMGQLSNAVTAAQKYGVTVWATPWSPPANLKTTNNVNGGSLTDTDAARTSWAKVLAGFATMMHSNGVTLYGISAQNEPDYNTTSYESCTYSAAQMVSFIDILGPQLAALTPPVKLIAPEPSNWGNLWGSYGPAILADTKAKAAIGIFASHDYGYGPVAPPSGVTVPIWETEVSGLQGGNQGGPSSDIGNGIAVAQWIYNALVTGNASAWHYWWLVSDNPDNEGLLLQGGDTTNPPLRVYTVGNFSKFVRPGYQRIDVSGPVPSGVQVVAFRNPADATTVVVAINSNTSTTTLPLFVGGTAWPSQVTPQVTSSTDKLAAKTALPLTAARVSATLGAQTVTTFVGKP
jgi:glucuronoarabinoxylan endo-1,4-beta-xylanase